MKERILDRRHFVGAAALTAFPRIAEAAATRPPKGFRSLFDGKTLKGWHRSPRAATFAYPGGPVPVQKPEQAERIARHLGKWVVEDGAIVGGQDPPGSGLGAYLVSEQKFGDFELMVDARPDWRVDTGILIRTVAAGSPGIQVLVDHRPDGNIGGFYGNGLGPFYAAPWWFKPKLDAQGNAIGLERAGESGESQRADPKLLAYGASFEEFLAAWKFGQWNTFKIRCEGKYPYLTSWINGVKMCELDTGVMKQNKYDRDAVANLLGRSGHIAFEVHSNDPRIGKDRWWPGAVCRWRNVFIKPLG